MAGHENTFLPPQPTQPLWWIICIFGKSGATPTGHVVIERFNNLSGPEQTRRLGLYNSVRILLRRDTVSSQVLNIFPLVVIVVAMAFVLLGLGFWLCSHDLRRRLVGHGKYMENEAAGDTTDTKLKTKNVRQTRSVGVEQLQLTVSRAGGPHSPSPSSNGETILSSRDDITDIDCAQGVSNIIPPPHSYPPAAASYRTTSMLASPGLFHPSTEQTNYPTVSRITSWTSRHSRRSSMTIRSTVGEVPDAVMTAESDQKTTPTRNLGANITVPEATYSFLYRPWSGSLSNDRDSQASGLTRLPSYQSTTGLPAYSVANRTSSTLSITE